MGVGSQSAGARPQLPATQAPAGFPLLQSSPDAMNGETLQHKVTITNPMGFHMRPAAAFAKRAAEFQSAVTVAKDDKRVNGKSWLELMLLAAEQGSEVLVEVSGSDARAALPALVELLAAPSMADDPPAEPTPPKG
jgi:phosphocarrier protein HPr